MISFFPLLDTWCHLSEYRGGSFEDTNGSGCQAKQLENTPAQVATLPAQRILGGIGCIDEERAPSGNAAKPVLIMSSSSGRFERRIIFPRQQVASPPSTENSDFSSTIFSTNTCTPHHRNELEVNSSFDSFSSSRDQEGDAIAQIPQSPDPKDSQDRQSILHPTAAVGDSASSPVPLISILRPSSKFASLSRNAGKTSVNKIPSVESDIPSLASTVSQSSVDDAAAFQQIKNAVALAKVSSGALRNPKTSFAHSEHKKISFDPRVWVREFSRSKEEEETTWFSSNDLETFKREVIQLMMERSETELVPTGTGRFVPRKVIPPSKAFFSNKALQLESEEDIALSESISEKVETRRKLAEQQVKRVLIVDPHDICIKLFTKGLRSIFPHIETVGVSTCEEALAHCESVSFDMILVEQRLKHIQHHQIHKCSISSGAELLKALKVKMEEAVLIGVSARLREDAVKLKTAGADICWPKPPPKMDEACADTLLRLVVERRGLVSLPP